MDDFLHLAAGSVSESNAQAVKEAIENITVTSESKPTTSTKEPSPDSSKQEKEGLAVALESEKQNISNLFEVLKKKSGDAAVICKEDINEIYSTIKDDANSTLISLKQGISAFSSSISEKYQKGQGDGNSSTAQREAQGAPVTSLFSNLNLFSSKPKLEEAANKFSAGLTSFFKNAIVIEAPEEVVEQEQKKMFDRKFAKLISLQNDVATYTADPSEVEKERESFKDFSLEMDEEDFPEKSFKLLEENPDMKSIFNRLVPNVLSQKVFWTRYYFRADLLEKEEMEKKALINNALDQEEELFSWDDEDSEAETEPSAEAKASLSFPTPGPEPATAQEEAKKDSKDGLKSTQPEADVESKSDKDDDDWGQWE
ncbi:hypothetical protein DSO57_1033380 [Entomophthora muscae]|uniref:Uncharacterized protein n=1 Tax=Entomophthora muscae TaxID=34485 RepID=A0ACC2U9Y3_9FUNG|nr:hypothetical protein DSO57_1033380 [Entomophthora muscae]